MAHSDDQKRKFLTVLREKNLHIGKACTSFGITRATFYEWKKEDWFAQEYEDMAEGEIDDAEEMHRYLRQGILKVEVVGGQRTVVGWHKEPDRQALHEFLRSKGKGRGWSENLQLSGTGAQGEIVIVTLPDNGRDKKE